MLFGELIKDSGDPYLNFIFNSIVLKEILPSDLRVGVFAFREFVVHWDRGFFTSISHISHEFSDHPATVCPMIR